MKKTFTHSNTLAKAQYYEKKLEEQNNKNVARNEKSYASDLHMAGRKAYYVEYFHGIKLEDQELPQIGPFEIITDTHHFKEGYKRGAFLVENNIIPEEYQEISKKHR